MTTDDGTTSFELRHAATDRATIVVVPTQRLFAIDGFGSPSGTDFRLATETLRAVSDALRARLRSTRSGDPGKGSIEAVWWTHPEVPIEQMADTFADRSAWHWQQLIEVPRTAAEADATAAIDATRVHAGQQLPLVRIVEITEGQTAQILNVGAAAEPDSLRKLGRELDAAGLQPRGHVHQIFLTDPHLVSADRARSILRIPVESRARPA